MVKYNDSRKVSIIFLRIFSWSFGLRPGANAQFEPAFDQLQLRRAGDRCSNAFEKKDLRRVFILTKVMGIQPDF